ncbi:M23 family metallopeptidase [Crocosphaera sp. UHCC 0190]|uniref:M23 family metallopeptidase n=1 Tax=Crocosphaera sp. UHCC 0190 TaxID=3110246 RepID=UPI002B208DEE|nr:M23 family metallopeptidase [Crocosphaera sp. UHCC 0190]MEA5511678.1 M23 family metallopeptidase [Crocosphaera sp. UHCC 0190]
MKFLSNRLFISGVSLGISFLCHNIVFASGETNSQQKRLSNTSGHHLPQTPQSLTGYIWPVQGVVTSGFGKRFNKMHTGVDIAGPMGTPIFAAATGVVVFTGWSPEGYGNLVTLHHPDGSLSLYGHNSRILVSQGQQVKQGEQIAEMGSTGNSTGPHLHFEIRPQGGVAVNPRAFLPTENPPISRSQNREITEVQEY